MSKVKKLRLEYQKLSQLSQIEEIKATALIQPAVSIINLPGNTSDSKN